VSASRADIDLHGAALCALSEGDMTARFRSHPDGSKASSFCGDVAYLSALLETFGFTDNTKLTMTNKIKDVELVWTLGAMLAKSAELANGGGAPSHVSTIFFVILVAAGMLWLCSSRSKSGYGRVQQPLQGHDSD